MAGIQRHEFDEAHLDVMLARERGKVCHFVFVVTAHDYRVDFDRLKLRILCRFDSLKYAIQNIDAGHLPENVALQTIQTDRDAIESCLLQTSRAIGKKITVGRESKIEQAFQFQLCQFTDDRLNIAAHHWFAAGQTNLFNSQLNKNVADVFNLFVREHLLFRRNRRLAVRQTIEAAKVAAIGQRHAQIANRAVIRVSEVAGHH